MKCLIYKRKETITSYSVIFVAFLTQVMANTFSKDKVTSQIVKKILEKNKSDDLFLFRHIPE